MKTLEVWLKEYSGDHRNFQNQAIHKICVPLIFFSISGALHLVPESIGDVAAGCVILSYLRWGVKPFLIMLAQWLVALTLTIGIAYYAGENTIWFLLLVFVFAWVGQFLGHEIEGRRPSFLTDVQYLLVGPLWIWLGR